MKVTALIPDDLIHEVKDLAHGKNITDSLVIALRDWISVQKLKNLRDRVRKHPLSFKKKFSSQNSRIKQEFMILADTSVWIEFFRGNEPYFSQVSDLLDKNELLALSPVFGELLQGAKNNKERSTILEFWNNLPHISEHELVIRAGMESGRNKWMDKGVGLIDSILIVAARETISFIWSLDNKLLRLLNNEEKYLTK